MVISGTERKNKPLENVLGLPPMIERKGLIHIEENNCFHYLEQKPRKRDLQGDSMNPRKCASPNQQYRKNNLKSRDDIQVPALTSSRQSLSLFFR
mmetsp:Transcript_18232/g.26730  ORF Transcript_18232/g.26730 Transcript_18232/m.26730 type:complete len:95 (+) Transcript_18232:267-551(+)